MYLDVVLVDDGAGPNFRHKLIFADHLAVGRGQDQEKFKGPATKLNRDSIPRQLSPPEIEPEWTKGNLIRRHGRNRYDVSFRKFSSEPRTLGIHPGMV